MRNLIIKKQIKCEFTPNQWELLTNTFDDKELRYVTNDLNESLEILYNGGSDKFTTHSTMLDEMKRYKKYGAYDSEPINFLETILNEIYGD